MSVKISGEYLGNKKVKLRHELSGTELITAAPLDNQGDGSSFSPTDLTAASLGSCMLTTMAIFAEKDGIDLSGMSMEVEKVMSANPRRIAELNLIITLPAKLSPEERIKLERVAHTCPVSRSLHAELHAPIEFRYL